MAHQEIRKPLHVLMVSFPGQGHINPLLRFAKFLASKGLLITFSSTDIIGRMVRSANKNTSETTLIGDGQLRFEFFPDGWEDDDPKRHDLDQMMPQLETTGRESLTRLITKQADLGQPISCVINNPFVPWVLDLATELSLPCAVFWVQSCAVYATYYHYFHKLASFPTPDEPHLSANIPGLPSLDHDEVPSFLHPSSPYTSLQKAILEQFKNLSRAFCVLVDSFQELEHEAIKTMSLLSSPIKPVGPLIKFPSDQATDQNSGNIIRADMWSAAEESLEWLDSQAPATVVYVSFGSIVALEKDQLAEMAYGLLSSKLPFLWAFRPPISKAEKRSDLPDGFIEEAEGKGLVVQWCPQDRVLAHPSVACFVTHCGWNSSMESLGSGVPVVAFPQWGDQVTNAKFLADVYGVGVRLLRSCEDLKSLTRADVARCIKEVTTGDKAEEMKRNALKWKRAAEEAVAEGGSSERNIQAFVDEIRRVGIHEPLTL